MSSNGEEEGREKKVKEVEEERRRFDKEEGQLEREGKKGMGRREEQNM